MRRKHGTFRPKPILASTGPDPGALRRVRTGRGECAAAPRRQGYHAPADAIRGVVRARAAIGILAQQARPARRSLGASIRRRLGVENGDQRLAHRTWRRPAKSPLHRNGFAPRLPLHCRHPAGQRRTDGTGAGSTSRHPRGAILRGTRRCHWRGFGQAWQSACSGRRSIVWVAGEPGIGKTALIEHFIASLGDVTSARGQCVDHYGTREPYLPVLEALADLSRPTTPSHRC